MINPFDFSNYIQPSKRFKESGYAQIIEENSPELKEKRTLLLKGLLEHLNNESESLE